MKLSFRLSMFEFSIGATCSMVCITVRVRVPMRVSIVALVIPLPLTNVVVHVLFALKVEGFSHRDLTLDGGVVKLVLIAYHIRHSLECLAGMVRSDVASHAHLAASKLPDMQVVVLADSVAGIEDVLL